MSPAAVAALGAVLFGSLLCTGGLGAEVLSAGGLTFSDERGGFRLIAASGTGTQADPLVLVEELTQMGPAILVIRGFKTRGQGDPDRPIQALSSGSLVITKVVLNGSQRVWTGFDLELREIVDTPSPYGDGLSFDQMDTFARTFGSDRFQNIRKLTEPYDLLDFDQGSVDPGTWVRFSFAITDPTPRQEFFLVQEPKLLLSQGPMDTQHAKRSVQFRPSSPPSSPP
jgi:hypothetical protein